MLYVGTEENKRQWNLYYLNGMVKWVSLNGRYKDNGWCGGGRAVAAETDVEEIFAQAEEIFAQAEETLTYQIEVRN